MARLKKLGRRRVQPDMVVSPELAHDLADLSAEIGRQIGLMLDRSGAVDAVVVGDGRGLFLPDLGRQRGGLTRFNGLRLVHTHLKHEGLDQDDLNDLASLRLDLIAALLVRTDGHPPSIEAAYLLPGAASGEEVVRLSARHAGALDVDFSGLIHSLEAELTRRQKSVQDVRGRESALLISVTSSSRVDAEEYMRELEELARTAGLRVMDSLIYRSRPTRGAQLLSQDRIAQLSIRALQSGVELLIFAHNLSPAQISKLTEQCELRIIDRTQLILDIFAQRAQTREGKLQVEMAQLNYLLPRLVKKNTAMSRLTGGIGGRGPGETKLEINRRRVRERIDRLRKELDGIKAQRSLHRARRAKAGLPVVSIVGYTNAGKSTLLNNMTRSDVLAEDKLFATLDPTSRRLKFPRDRAIIITDTVGFIRDLPPDLIEAFSATLEELNGADLLLHVIDGASPHLEEHMATVEKLLDSMDLGNTPVLRVMNKVDMMEPELAQNLCRRLSAVAVSALDPGTFGPLIEAIQMRLGWVDQPRTV